MKKILSLFTLAYLLCIGNNSFAQIRKIPAAVTDSFSAKFPEAKNLEWGDRITVFEATFDMDDHKYQASFNSDGNWKKTEKFLTDDEVPSAVKDGLAKSKYSDWEIKANVEVTRDDDSLQYRLFAKKNDLQKKYLYFNTDGKLIRDSITL
ncbi:MAG: PepSY-like domain-containing protein [Ferruginibacter sp.]